MKTNTIAALFLTFAIAGSPVMADAGELSVPAVFQFNKTSILKKKLESARSQIRVENYDAARKTINSIFKIDPDNEEANDLLTTLEKSIEQRRQRWHQEYLAACSQDGTQALQDFVAKYPQSEDVENAKNRINDYTLWQKAKDENTIAAYESYLSHSSVHAYNDEAKAAITDIQAKNEWDACKESGDENKLEAFMNKYPESIYSPTAKRELCLLKGERFYAAKDYDNAFINLDAADKTTAISGEAAEHLKELKDMRTFNSMMASDNADIVKNYFESLSSDSPYYGQMSNHLARLLAPTLSSYSTDYRMDEVLGYAKDEATKQYVERYVNIAKADRARLNRIRRAEARKLWWKDRFMVGWNTFHVDYMDKVMSIGTGVRFRFGRWSDVVNLVFGAEYSYVMHIVKEDYGYSDDYDYDQERITHAVEIPVGLRFNLFRVGSSCKFYVGCNASFGFNFSSASDFYVDKHTTAIEPQIGFASRSLDFGLYYKQYLKDRNLLSYTDKGGNHRVGLFLTWYIW